jgi:SAM-dependent methyltransferase
MRPARRAGWGEGRRASHEPVYLGAGGTTAYGGIVDYRLDKLAGHGVVHGDWLDYGCAEGSYSLALSARGAWSVVGVDVIPERIETARSRPHPTTVTFELVGTGNLPFDDETFDGALVNEVLEHVGDEASSLAELRRVLRPGGVLALFSPNRWFPFEGHGARLPNGRWLTRQPVPLMPWLPTRFTRRVATARNYWPGELREVIADAGFDVMSSEWALAQFDAYAWMPQPMIAWYHRNLARIEHSPVARVAAVSTLVVARRPDAASRRVAPDFTLDLAEAERRSTPERAADVSRGDPS